jgi:undecaprenyl pyrophosphate phosphatase UppP
MIGAIDEKKQTIMKGLFHSISEREQIRFSFLYIMKIQLGAFIPFMQWSNP